MYGVTPGYGGRNYLTGPGLAEPPLDDNDAAVNGVVTRRGGYWEHRFRQQCEERGGVDEDDIYEAHWNWNRKKTGEDDVAAVLHGQGIADVMCRGKKQACGRYPSPRDLIPKYKWDGVSLPEEDLRVPDSPKDPRTGGDITPERPLKRERSEEEDNRRAMPPRGDL